MLLRILNYFTFLFLLLASVIYSPVYAQSSVTTDVQTPDGFTFQLPGDWRSGETDLGQLYVHDTTTLRVIGPQVITSSLSVGDTDSPSSVLLRAHEMLYAWQPDVANVELVTISAKSAAILRRPEGDVSLIFAAVEIEPHQYMVFDLTFPSSQSDAFQTLLFAVATLSSTTSTASSTSQPTTTPTVAATTVSQAESTPEATESPFISCTITATSPKSATLRVGPGTNRSSIAFLPTQTEFHPLGRYILKSDNSIWFKLVKEEAAPATAASEIWVAGIEVKLSGNCDSAPEVTPNVPKGAGRPSLVFRSGRWQFNYDPITNASCLDFPNFRMSTFDALDFRGTTPSLNQPGTVALSNNGQEMSFTNEATKDTFRYTYIQKEKYYFLTQAPSNSFNWQWRIYPISSTQARSEQIGNYDIQGHKCSATIVATFNYIGG